MTAPKATDSRAASTQNSPEREVLERYYRRRIEAIRGAAPIDPEKFISIEELRAIADESRVPSPFAGGRSTLEV